MLDPGPPATSRTPQPSQAVPKRLPEAPRLPGGYPDVIRRLSGFDRYGSSYILSPMELASCLCQSLPTVLHFGPRRSNPPQTYDEPMTKHTHPRKIRLFRILNHERIEQVPVLRKSCTDIASKHVKHNTQA